MRTGRIAPSLLVVMALAAGCSGAPVDPAPTPAEPVPASEVATPKAPVLPGPADTLATAEAVGRQPRLVRSWAAGEVSALYLGRQGGQALVGSRDGQVTRWMLPEAMLEQRWDGPPEGGEGPTVAVGLWWSHVWAIWEIGGELVLADLNDGRIADRVAAPQPGIVASEFPRDDERLFLALGDGSVVSWKPPSGALESVETPLPVLDPMVEDVRWESAGLSGSTALGTRANQAVTVRELRAEPALLSADGLVLLGVQDGRLSVWSLEGTRALEDWGAAGPVQRLAFSPHGLMVAVDHDEAGLELRDAATGLVLAPVVEPALLGDWSPFRESTEPSAFDGLPGVAAVARSPDGRWLVTADEAGALRRWDLDAVRQGRMLDTRLDRMLRQAPYASDTLLARAEVAALAGQWSRVADLLALAERQGATVHPARQLRALCLAGRLGGAREVLGLLPPVFREDPAVRAWEGWLEAQEG